MGRLREIMGLDEMFHTEIGVYIIQYINIYVYIIVSKLFPSMFTKHPLYIKHKNDILTMYPIYFVFIFLIV